MELSVERCIDCVDGAAQQQRVAIGLSPSNRFGRYIGASTRPIFDNELLAEPLRQPLPDQTRSEIKVPAGSKADDDAHGSRRIVLRPWGSSNGRQEGSDGGAAADG